MYQLKHSVFLLLILSLFLVARVNAEKITVAVASNFMLVFEALITDFERLNLGSEVVLVSGSSGKIYAQIKHGAPFDIFMSADQDKPLRLVKEGLAIPETRFTYAVGSLVLWSANSDLINNSGDILKKSAFNKLALANSKLAPYGLAAEQVLAQLGILDASRSKWVQGENIAQTYQFVETKNADLGFVAKSQVWKRGRLVSGSAWVIPPELYSGIKQDAVTLKAAKNNKLAKKMMYYLQSSEVRSKIEAYGYQSVVIETTTLEFGLNKGGLH